NKIKLKFIEINFYPFNSLLKASIIYILLIVS
ncbi:hypothetical protein cje34_08319, partial [Campylobacter jejuni subsp. jejuni 87459]